MATQGGPATRVAVQSSGRRQGGAALPVAVVSDGRAVQGGPAMPIYVVTSGPVQGGPALPIVAAASGAPVAAGPALPVYVVSGSLNPAPQITPFFASAVSYWKHDEANGAARADSIASNTLANNNGATSVTGKIATASGFDSTLSQYLLATANASLQLGSDSAFAVAFWAMITSKTDTRTIVSKRSGAGIELQVTYNSGTDSYDFFVGNGVSTGTLNTVGSPPLNTYQFCVFWHDAAANTLNAQFDGGAVQSTAWVGGTLAGAGDFIVGRRGPNNDGYWHGRIDEMLYAIGAVPTASDLAYIYNGGAGRTWPMTGV